MDSATLSNLVAYSAQIAGIVAVASVIPAAIRLSAIDVRYAYWRIVFALCLLLPWLQTRQSAASPIQVTSDFVPAMSTVAQVSERAVATTTPVHWPTLALWTIVIGAALRLSWLVIGLVRLRRMRSVGTPADASEFLSDLQKAIGTRAEVRHVDGLSQPVTFGLVKPVILLPSTLREQPPDIQRIVLGHELLHVERRDWAWLVVEEIVCAVFWFHPAIWWLISRIQLAREEVVDQMAVLLAGQRKRYVEALLAFADTRPVVLTAPFARRRHLLRRIELISREGVMSSKRVVFSCAVMTLAVVMGGWYAVKAFPLQDSGAADLPQSAIGPLEQRAQPITPENPIPRRLVSTEAIYPAEAAATGARGAVHLRVTIDESGRVREARPIHVSASTIGEPNPFSLSFDDPGVDAQRFLDQVGKRLGSTAAAGVVSSFVQAALVAVRQWQYDPPARAPISFAAVFTFQPPGQVSSAQVAQPPPPPPAPPGSPRKLFSGTIPGAGTVDVGGALRVGGPIAPPKKIKHVPPVYPPIAQSARVSGVVIIEARLEPDGHVSQAGVVKSIPLLDQAALDAVRQWVFTPTLMNGVPTPLIMTLTVNFVLDPGPASPLPNNAAGDVTLLSDGAIRIGGDIKPPKKIRHVPPVYPAEAQANHITGVVIIQARIEADGTVSRTLVLKSVPGLDEAAVEAVRQWVFEPTLLNGQPTPVVMTVTVNFTLE